MKPCLLIPIHDHGSTIAAVVRDLAPYEVDCLVVDDGSGPATRQVLERVAKEHRFVEVLRCDRNSGKGAALKIGYRAARARGFTHAVQLDADGQHDPTDVPRFLDAMRADPEALVLGVPLFDASAPRARLIARQLSRVSVWLACWSRVVPDPLCGFRGVPLQATVELLDREPMGDWMDFDPELSVRLVWEGVPVVPIPTRVIYHVGGLSHYSVLRDYPRLAGLYVRLVFGGLRRGAALRRRTAGEAR